MSDDTSSIDPVHPSRPEMEDIKAAVSETIKELHEAQAVKIKKPETLQGWLWTIGAIGGFIAFIVSTIIYLDSISQHHKLPVHPGAQEIIEEIKHMNRQHALDTEVHRSEEHLQLQILRETRPIQEDIHLIKEDVRSIQTKVDILIDRQERER